MTSIVSASASAVPSLTASSSTTPMTTSPRTASPGLQDVVKTATDEDGVVNVEEIKEELQEEIESDPQASARAARLSFLLDKSTIYAKIIGDRMARQQIEKQKAEERAAARKNKKRGTEPPHRDGLRDVKKEKNEEISSKRKRKSDVGGVGKKVKTEAGEAEEVEKLEINETEPPSTSVPQEEEEGQGEEAKQYSFEQPALVTGAKLRDYQLAGVQWMISLYENGLNGILADEMGLGKTLQTISFLAHLRSKGTWGPFLIVCPLSVLNNWIMEFEKFTPSIPVIMYHGAPDHRAHLRATRLQPPIAAGVGNMNKRKSTGSYSGQTTQTFPVVVTTYEMCMKDRKFLSGFQWKFIVVDEGHRLKNLDCKLIRELKTYTSANRMILTGTPLHNNLAELWSLLNFILPDIFDDLDSFQQWFNFDEMSASGDATESLLNKSSIVSSLHAILKPFLLRRLKVDVEKDLPPKKEYLLYAPLTQQQKDIYQAIVSRQIRQYLVDKKSGTSQEAVPEVKEETILDETPGKKTRKQARKSYKIEENDSRYLRELELRRDEPAVVKEKSAAEIGREWAHKQATKHVNNMHLQNLVMQLRKISSHPFLFDWPSDPSGQLVVNEDLVNASGKMLLLNRLLDALFDRGHKVLIFSQFTTMLDVIEDWATSYKGWKICRIDGSTSQQLRREQMEEFNNGKGDDACKLFLLSTRAGGLGVNLVAADTVIFFDQDWNPQMDLQAQDRAHRIGQTRPVLIFRLVSAHTVETHILQKAGNKRKLEALVISQGKFGRVVDENGKVLLGRKAGKAGNKESVADMAKALLDLEGEEINIASADDTIIGDADLEILLDRSPAAYAREKGWSAGLGKAGAAGRSEQIKKGEKTAFEVFVPAKDDVQDGLAQMFGGDDEKEEE
ncbi:SNF2 family N-terminal domain-domain-containing protein [Naematelia encephala]|uniref:SNF2 family N-terminal domain-domain-containing protein n=1 Tax=Naematelia encephala TaxID=71784 RepID=A0A1Y2BAX9_9TREE|nr:SNF2 family N-terminal domain-domain-containing protein [Naematelia encephala]